MAQSQFPSTINEFLLQFIPSKSDVEKFLTKKFLGKKISIRLREERDVNNVIVNKGLSTSQTGTLFSEWEHRIWSKDNPGQREDKEFWFRDVLISEKVMVIKPYYKDWMLITKSGYKIRLYPHTEILN